MNDCSDEREHAKELLIYLREASLVSYESLGRVLLAGSDLENSGCGFLPLSQ